MEENQKKEKDLKRIFLIASIVLNVALLIGVVFLVIRQGNQPEPQVDEKNAVTASGDVNAVTVTGTEAQNTDINEAKQENVSGQKADPVKEVDEKEATEKEDTGNNNGTVATESDNSEENRNEMSEKTDSYDIEKYRFENVDKNSYYSGHLAYCSDYLSDDQINKLMPRIYYETGKEMWGEKYDIYLAYGHISARYSIYEKMVYYDSVYSVFPYNLNLVLCRCKGKVLKKIIDYGMEVEYPVKFNVYYETRRKPDWDIKEDEDYYIITDTGSLDDYNLKIVDYYYSDVYPRDLLADWFLSDTDESIVEKYFVRHPEDFPVIDSSTARKPITEGIFDYFIGDNNCVKKPMCSKTHGAWLNLADGVADLVFLVKPTKEEEDYFREKQVDIECKLYGCDGLAFIISPDAPVKNLTSEQIKGIYEGTIRNWKELGGPDHEIHPFVRDPQSGSQRLFESLMWPDGDIPEFPYQLDQDIETIYTEYADMETITYAVIEDPYSIGYNIVSYLNDGYYGEIDLMSVDGAFPDSEHFADMSYPFTTQAYVAIRADEPEGSPARRLFDWIGSTKCNGIVLNNSSLSIVDGTVELLKYTD